MIFPKTGFKLLCTVQFIYEYVDRKIVIFINISKVLGIHQTVPINDDFNTFKNYSESPLQF
jgi:hypothetical protein